MDRHEQREFALPLEQKQKEPVEKNPRVEGGRDDVTFVFLSGAKGKTNEARRKDFSLCFSFSYFFVYIYEITLNYTSHDLLF